MPRAAPNDDKNPTCNVSGRLRLWREGEYWGLRYGGQVIRLRHSKGLGYLAILLGRHDEPVAARELVAMLGQDGPGRGAGNATSAAQAKAKSADDERSRVGVYRAIDGALGRINACHPALAAYLRAGLRTGKYCSYSPPPRVRRQGASEAAPTSWQGFKVFR